MILRRLLGIAALTAMLAAFVPAAQAVDNPGIVLQGTSCEQKSPQGQAIYSYCIYADPALRQNIASLTAVPRFYHMAQSCYLQAAMLGTMKYYNKAFRPAQDKAKELTAADTGVDEWQLPTFCLPNKDKHGQVIYNDVVLNEHVVQNVLLLYHQDDNSTSLYDSLEYYNERFAKDPTAALATTNMATPDQLVSDILWREYLSYNAYLGEIQRTPDDFQRAAVWANDAASNVPNDWTQFLRRQIDMATNLDNKVDVQLAKVTRAAADILYGEFLRTYPEHLQYLLMRQKVGDIATNMDRIERALASLSIKLPDAFVTGN